MKAPSKQSTESVFLSGGGSASVSNARPANTTAYSAEDVVGGATSGILRFREIGPVGRGVLIIAAELIIPLASLPSGMAGFRLELFTASPTAILDNAAFSVQSADALLYAGSIDLGTPAVVGAHLLFASNPAVNMPVLLTTSDLFANLVTEAGYTPASGTVYTARLHATPL